MRLGFAQAGLVGGRSLPVGFELFELLPVPPALVVEFCKTGIELLLRKLELSFELCPGGLLLLAVSLEPLKLLVQPRRFFGDRLAVGVKLAPGGIELVAG